jgi:hypothetical protein
MALRLRSIALTLTLGLVGCGDGSDDPLLVTSTPTARAEAIPESIRFFDPAGLTPTVYSAFSTRTRTPTPTPSTAESSSGLRAVGFGGTDVCRRSRRRQCRDRQFTSSAATDGTRVEAHTLLRRGHAAVAEEYAPRRNPDSPGTSSRRSRAVPGGSCTSWPCSPAQTVLTFSTAPRRGGAEVRRADGAGVSRAGQHRPA